MRWADVKSFEHIVMSTKSSVRQLVDAEYALHGVQLRPGFEVQHVGTMLGLIAASQGIGVLPQSLAKTLALAGIAYRRFAAELSYRSICSVTLLGRTPPPTVPEFVRHFRRHCVAA